MKQIVCIIAFICLIGIAESSGKNAVPQNRLYGKSGYSGNVTLGGTVGLAYDFGSKTTLMTSHGYRFGNGAFIGMGSGIILDLAGQSSIPLFSEFKYSILNNAISPFVGYKLGISLYDLAYLTIFTSPSVGVDIGRFSFAAIYIFQDCLDAVYDNGVIKAFRGHWLSLTVGVWF